MENFNNKAILKDSQWIYFKYSNGREFECFIEYLRLYDITI
jgi:hypothetical protein